MKRLKDCIIFKESHLIFLLCAGSMLCAEYGKSAVNRIWDGEPKQTTEIQADIQADSSEILMDSAESIKSQLVAEVDSYMRDAAKSPRMSAEYMVTACLENEFDLPLAISQAQIETHFGMTAKKSNSCFGVTCRSFKNTNESIDHYIGLMQSKYLINRDVNELIASNFSQEKSPKHKYAGSHKYGSKIKNVRDRIISGTRIHELSEKYADIRRQASEKITRENSNYYIMTA